MSQEDFEALQIENAKLKDQLAKAELKQKVIDVLQEQVVEAEARNLQSEKECEELKAKTLTLSKELEEVKYDMRAGMKAKILKESQERIKEKDNKWLRISMSRITEEWRCKGLEKAWLRWTRFMAGSSKSEDPDLDELEPRIVRNIRLNSVVRRIYSQVFQQDILNSFHQWRGVVTHVRQSYMKMRGWLMRLTAAVAMPTLYSNFHIWHAITQEDRAAAWNRRVDQIAVLRKWVQASKSPQQYSSFCRWRHIVNVAKAEEWKEAALVRLKSRRVLSRLVSSLKNQFAYRCFVRWRGKAKISSANLYLQQLIVGKSKLRYHSFEDIDKENTIVEVSGPQLAGLVQAIMERKHHLSQKESQLDYLAHEHLKEMIHERGVSIAAVPSRSRTGTLVAKLPFALKRQPMGISESKAAGLISPFSTPKDPIPPDGRPPLKKVPPRQRRGSTQPNTPSPSKSKPKPQADMPASPKPSSAPSTSSPLRPSTPPERSAKDFVADPQKESSLASAFPPSPFTDDASSQSHHQSVFDLSPVPVTDIHGSLCLGGIMTSVSKFERFLEQSMTSSWRGLTRSQLVAALNQAYQLLDKRTQHLYEEQRVQEEMKRKFDLAIAGLHRQIGALKAAANSRGSLNKGSPRLSRTSSLVGSPGAVLQRRDSISSIGSSGSFPAHNSPQEGLKAHPSPPSALERRGSLSGLVSKGGHIPALSPRTQAHVQDELGGTKRRAESPGLAEWAARTRVTMKDTIPVDVLAWAEEVKYKWTLWEALASLKYGVGGTYLAFSMWSRFGKHPDLVRAEAAVRRARGHVLALTREYHDLTRGVETLEEVAEWASNVLQRYNKADPARQYKKQSRTHHVDVRSLMLAAQNDQEEIYHDVMARAKGLLGIDEGSSGSLVNWQEQLRGSLEDEQAEVLLQKKLVAFVVEFASLRSQVTSLSVQNLQSTISKEEDFNQGYGGSAAKGNDLASMPEESF